MSLWTDRDLPVLAHLDEHPPEHAYLWTDRASEDPHSALPDVTKQEFHIAVLALYSAGYVSSDQPPKESGGGEVGWSGFQVTGAGKQVLGEWPLFEALGEPSALAAVLDKLAETAATDEEEANLTDAAGGIRKFSRESLEGAASAALAAFVRSQIGI